MDSAESMESTESAESAESWGVRKCWQNIYIRDRWTESSPPRAGRGKIHTPKSPGKRRVGGHSSKIKHTLTEMLHTRGNRRSHREAIKTHTTVRQRRSRRSCRGVGGVGGVAKHTQNTCVLKRTAESSTGPRSHPVSLHEKNQVLRVALRSHPLLRKETFKR